MNTILTHLHTLFANFGPFFILLGILIFVHELGHFLVAKYYGVRVEVFSLGFGKKILKYKRGDTTYCLSVIPLGGYVKMFGDDPSADVPAEERKHAFLHKPVYQRFAVVLAGPLMNLFFAIVVFSMIAWVGEDVPGPYLGDITTESKAYEMGFRSGDTVLEVAGKPIQNWIELDKQIQQHGGETITFKISREGEPAPVEIPAAVGFGDNENLFSFKKSVGQIPGFTSESRSSVVGVHDPKSPAGEAQLMNMSLIGTVNGKKVTYWRELNSVIRKSTPDDAKTVTFGIRSLDQPDSNEELKKVELPLPKNWKTNPDILASLGLESAELYIYQVTKKSPAETIGLTSGDRLFSIDGVEVHSWNDVLNHVKTYNPSSDGMNFVIVRAGENKSFKVKPEMTTLMTANGQEEHRFTIGIRSGLFPVGPNPVPFRITNPVGIVKYGVQETQRWTEFVVMSLVRLVEGDVSAKNIGGVITIGRVAAHSFAAGMTAFLKMMGLISINLFLLNLLPIPILDGGHLVFYSIEALRGTPLSLRKMEIAQQVGLMLLMFLMAFAFFNDISNMWSSRM
jgi:regulator of sigma E protease